VGKNAPTLLEVARFLEAAQALGAREHALASLLCLHGLPLSEVCQAWVSDLRRSGPAWTFRIALGPGMHRAAITLAPRATAALAAYLGERAMGPLFLDDDGLPLRPETASGLIRRIVHASGLDYRLQ
jgi:integrase